jgi:hypothetical protein
MEKAGSLGAIVAAAACPVCFPKLALIGAMVGLGGLGAYEWQLLIVAQGLVGVAAIAHVIGFVRHHRRAVLGVALSGVGAIFAGLYLAGSEWLVYAGFAALLVVSFAGLWERGRSTLTCPSCGHTQRETMPTDACLFFYECMGCGALQKPKAGDCCVFCSYGTRKCPPRRATLGA